MVNLLLLKNERVDEEIEVDVGVTMDYKFYIIRFKVTIDSTFYIGKFKHQIN